MGIFDKMSKEQIEAICTIDQDLQIIACAGSGKTSVVTRRIINIIKQRRAKPEEIVAFTFTEKAGKELKTRIYKYAEEELGNTEGFANMYIGTIHGYCLSILKEYFPERRSFSVLDIAKTQLFINKYYSECGMSELGLTRYTKTDLFMNLTSILNENINSANNWPEEYKQIVKKYKKCFFSHKYMDYSLITSEMYVKLMKDNAFRSYVQKRIKYLTVDEYQDVNPLQDELIKIIKDGGCNICVVGDDDQTIYEFRGSDSNTLNLFKENYDVKSVVLNTNYRSSVAIVDIADRVIEKNSYRCNKLMKSCSNIKYDECDAIYQEFTTFDEEANFIANRIKEFHNCGIPYSEMAILIRKKKYGTEIVHALEKHGIKYIVSGVNELFERHEIKAANGIFLYIRGEKTIEHLISLWKNAIDNLDECLLCKAISNLPQTKDGELTISGDFNLQKTYQDFIATISIFEKRNIDERILYNLGKYSQIINDYETICFKDKPNYKLDGFLNFIEYQASSMYPEGILSNEYLASEDAVSIMTIHQSKGLEFTAVFLPQLNNNGIPAKKMKENGIWDIIDKKYIKNSSLMIGEDEEKRMEAERRLFYVAVTRSKKYIIMTRSPYKGERKPSIFYIESKNSPYLLEYDELMDHRNDTLPRFEKTDNSLTLNFSILQNYFNCPFSFKLSVFFGFVQPLSTGIGYGESIHNIVHVIHEKYIKGEIVLESMIKSIVNDYFYLPYANELYLEKMKNSAYKSVLNYYENNKKDFNSIIFAEKNIELKLTDSIRINGRIDLVKKREISGESKTYITDFKSANRDIVECISSEQLKIYALGYKHLTGTSADYLEIYNLDNQEQQRERVTDEMIENVKTNIISAASAIRNNDFCKSKNTKTCRNCYLNELCQSK